MSNVINDLQWMQRALALAERGRGYVEPNPLVGAVIVRQDQIVGEGWHQRYGEAHAEVNALQSAGDNAQGATLYVTLEPCRHHGKTPPCTDAVLRAKLQRVVVAMVDPFPQVSGGGITQLRKAGLEVDVGIGAEEARRLNLPYLKLLRTGMPYVHLKWAMTLDGKIATRTGDSKWISNEASRRQVHQLRGRVDGILVGLGTLRADDPLLNARPPGPRIATRIVLDSRGEILLGSQLVRTAGDYPTLIVTTDQMADSAKESLQQAGCEVLVLPSAFCLLPSEEGHVSLSALLRELGKRRMTNLLVEGGSAVLGSFVDQRLVDEVHVYVSPRLAGGRQGLSPIGGLGVEKMSEAIPLTEWTYETLEGDLKIHGRIDAESPPPQ